MTTATGREDQAYSTSDEDDRDSETWEDYPGNVVRDREKEQESMIQRQQLNRKIGTHKIYAYSFVKALTKSRTDRVDENRIVTLSRSATLVDTRGDDVELLKRLWDDMLDWHKRQRRMKERMMEPFLDRLRRRYQDYVHAVSYVYRLQVCDVLQGFIPPMDHPLDHPSEDWIRQDNIPRRISGEDLENHPEQDISLGDYSPRRQAGTTSLAEDVGE